MPLIAEFKRPNVFRRGLAGVVITALIVAPGYFAWQEFGTDSKPAPPLSELFEADSATSHQLATTEPPHAGPPVGPVPPAEKSIAVLPFTHQRKSQENNRFLADGIHHDLHTKLSTIQGLQVSPRASVMSYRGAAENLQEVSAELGVARLLLGDVQQAGERIQINVRLIDATTEEQLWAESWDRGLSTENIFEIQGETARAIAHTLKAALSPEQETSFGSAPTASFAAYQAVLISRQMAHQQGFEPLTAAIAKAHEAIERDPNYADAYLALAFALTQGIYAGMYPDEQAAAEISRAVNQAMLLYPGYDQADFVRDHLQIAAGLEQSDMHFGDDLKTNKGDAATLFGYAYLVQSSGKPEQALPLLLRVLELDPRSPGVLYTLARTYDALEAYVEASEVFARLRKIDPANPLGYAPASIAYYARGQIDLALYWLDQGQTMDPRNYEIAGAMVFFYDDLEDYFAAGEWTAWLERRVTNQPLPMAAQARHHYLMGEFETALQYSNLALRLGLPDRLGSDAIFMRIKRDEALADGLPEAGITEFRSQHPQLFTQAPEITADNLLQAVDLALLFKLAGRTDEMTRLLRKAIEYYDQPGAVAGSVRANLVPARAAALAIMDNKAAALAELRRIIDKGWRMNWRWQTELNFNFNGIREDSGFTTMMDELRSDMNLQRANVQAMGERGEIKAPPVRR